MGPIRSRAATLTLFLALLAVPVMAGCVTTGSAASQPADMADLPILWQKGGAYSRLTRQVRVVARDRATLARIPLADVPVDFDTQMVLITGLGPTPAREAGIRIVRVWRDGSRIRVRERRIHPGLEGEASGAGTAASPWTICVVPKSDLNVEGYAARVPRGAVSGMPK